MTGKKQHRSGKKIKLSTGVTVFVATVPQKLADILNTKYPDPKVPIVEDTAHPTATGEPVMVEDRNDPQYRRELAETQRKRWAAWAEGQLLFGLPDVVVPEGWEPPTDDIQYLDPDWEPKGGERGRKLDYLEWGLLSDPADWALFFATINELAGVSEEATDAVEETFPSDVEEEGD